MYSLRNLLLFALLLGSLVIWGITAYSSYRLAQSEVGELFDAELVQSAKVLHSFINSLDQNGSGLNLEPQEVLLSYRQQVHHRYEKKIAFQFWLKNQKLILKSDSAPDYPLSNLENGYSQRMIDEKLWYVFTITDTNSSPEYVIHVAQQADIREALTGMIAMQLTLQFLFGLPFLGILIWLIIGRGLRPIHLLTEQLKHREVNYLEPLSAASQPKELLPVINALNTLFFRLEHAFEHERRFTADASHELRTPLAGLMTQAQVALKTEDEKVRKRALSHIQKAVQRMTEMLQQLLTLSRIDSHTDDLQQTSDLEKITLEIMAELECGAYQKQIQIEIRLQSSTQIYADPVLMAILIRNLLGNAIKYTPTGGNIRIYLTRKQNTVCLGVEDSGPGIEPAERENVLKRFYRCIETANQVPGSGLGLSIVQRICSIHRAQLSLENSALGGLKVEVNFPPL